MLFVSDIAGGRDTLVTDAIGDLFDRVQVSDGVVVKPWNENWQCYGISNQVGGGQLFGVGGSVGSPHFGVVKLGPKEAAFHKYCSVETTKGECPYLGNKTFDMASFTLFSQTVQRATGKDNLLVTTSSDLLEASGLQGSVIARQYGYISDTDVLSLFELVRALCLELDLDILRYKKVVLYSRERNYYTTLIFKHDQEAERFYNKMRITF